MADVASQIAIVETADQIAVACPHARTKHGSALTGGTGCARIVARVPAGSDVMPGSFEAHATFGGVRIEGVVGSVRASASFDLHVSVTPTKDAKISVINGNDGTTLTCPVVVVVPPTFTTNGLLVESFHLQPGVFTDFPDLAVASCGPPVGALQTVYPGAGPYPCISNAASHKGGASAAGLIEVLAGVGSAYFVSSPSRAPAWTAGRCDR